MGPGARGSLIRSKRLIFMSWWIFGFDLWEVGSVYELQKVDNKSAR